jgi:hypothetical protein
MTAASISREGERETGPVNKATWPHAAEDYSVDTSVRKPDLTFQSFSKFRLNTGNTNEVLYKISRTYFVAQILRHRS